MLSPSNKHVKDTLGVEVTIVKVPYHAALRAALTDTAYRCLRARVPAASASRTPAVASHPMQASVTLCP